MGRKWLLLNLLRAVRGKRLSFLEVRGSGACRSENAGLRRLLWFLEMPQENEGWTKILKREVG
jgi:hypothetical protein